MLVVSYSNIKWIIVFWNSLRLKLVYPSFIKGLRKVTNLGGGRPSNKETSLTSYSPWFSAVHMYNCKHVKKSSNLSVLQITNLWPMWRYPWSARLEWIQFASTEITCNIVRMQPLFVTSVTTDRTIKLQ